MPDLAPLPVALIVHAVVVPVPANRKELRTSTPTAPVRWLTQPEAYGAPSETNVHETLSQVQRLLAPLWTYSARSGFPGPGAYKSKRPREPEGGEHGPTERGDFGDLIALDP